MSESFENKQKGIIIYISKGDLIPLCPYPKDDCELCPAMVNPETIIPPCRRKKTTKERG
jgi:hypothetical protein